MARRVILDTGVLIAIERGRLDVDTVLGLDDAAIAAITAMELLAGVERADTAHRQARALSNADAAETLTALRRVEEVKQ